MCIWKEHSLTQRTCKLRVGIGVCNDCVYIFVILLVFLRHRLGPCISVVHVWRQIIAAGTHRCRFRRCHSHGCPCGWLSLAHGPRGLLSEWRWSISAGLQHSGPISQQMAAVHKYVSCVFVSNSMYMYGFVLYSLVACSHQRSWQYFAESTRKPKAFRARQCNSYISNPDPTFEPSDCDDSVVAYMGMHVDKRCS